MGWLDLFCSPRDSQESSTPQFKSINSLVFSFLYSPTLTSVIRFRFPDKIILGLGWALKSMTGVLIGEKQRDIWERDPEEKVIWWWRYTLEWCIYKPRIVKDYSSPQKRGEIYSNSPSEPPETPKCIDTLISEFCPMKECLSFPFIQCVGICYWSCRKFIQIIYQETGQCYNQHLKMWKWLWNESMKNRLGRILF